MLLGRGGGRYRLLDWWLLVFASRVGKEWVPVVEDYGVMWKDGRSE